MKILIIESSTAVCSVSIVDRDEVLVNLESEDFSHASLLAVKIRDCLNQLEIKAKDLSAVAISAGPGSYTGLRVGTATAKGICFASKIPLIALDTLKGLSYAPVKLDQSKNNYIFSLIDARRDEVYAAVFDPNHHVLLPGKAEILDSNSFGRFRQANAHWHLCGDGSSKALELLNFEFSTVCTTKTSANYFHQLAVNAFLKEDFVGLAYFSPNYFKAPNITVSNKTLI